MSGWKTPIPPEIEEGEVKQIGLSFNPEDVEKTIEVMLGLATELEVNAPEDSHYERRADKSMAKAFKALIPAYVKHIAEAVGSENSSPGTVAVGLSRAMAMLMAITLVGQAKKGHEEDAARTMGEAWSEDLQHLTLLFSGKKRGRIKVEVSPAGPEFTKTVH